MTRKDRLQELAALHAVGALESADAAEFRVLMADRASGMAEELRAFQKVAEALAGSAKPVTPPPGLRDRLLGSLPALKSSSTANPPAAAPEIPPAFLFLKDTGDEGWQPMPVKGAYVKPLHLDPERGYALVLGKLDPGTHYPAHDHIGPEQIYVLSGDLHIGNTVMGPGDFHHAAPSSSHGVNASVNGCTILLVITLADLQAQLALA